MSMFRFLRHMTGRSSSSRARTSGTPGRRRSPWLGVEVLEGRWLPHAVLWTAPLAGNWSTAANWTDEASGSHHVPAAADSAVFDPRATAKGFSGSAFSATVDTGFSIQSLKIQPTYDATITLRGSTLTLGGTEGYHQEGGTFDVGSGILRLTGGSILLTGGTLLVNTGIISDAGDWKVAGGTFVAGDGTVSFTGASSQSIISGGQHFQNLAHTGSGTLTLLDPLAVDGSLTSAKPTVVFSLQGQQTFVAGSAPASVTVADVNDDGIPDLIVADPISNSVGVLLGNGDGTFGAQHTFAAGTHPTFVAVADVNGDSRPDLVVANENDNSVSVLLGNGNGTFQTQHTFATGNAPRSVAVADVNGDGKLDLVVADSQSNALSVLLGNGNGTFQVQHTFTAGPGPVSVAAADVNSDGKPDLVVANENSGTVSVLLGTGNGTFGAQQTFATGAHPTLVVVVADFNDDGKLDLAVANSVGGTVSVLLGNGNGTFQNPRSFAAGSGAAAVVAADVNDDGILDLVTVNPNSNTVGVLLGNGNGTFQAQRTFAAGSGPAAVAVADVNDDGKPDLVAANASDGIVSVLLNRSILVAGTIQPAQSYATGFHPKSVAVADLNGDGKPDLVTANRESNTVSVLLGTGNGTFQAQQTYATGLLPNSVVVADVNGDGKLDLVVANRNNIGSAGVLLGNGDGTFQAQHTFASGAFPYSVAVADVNGDGKPDLVLLDYFARQISVLLGNGNDTFQAPQFIGAGPYTTAVTVADVNGDGKPDLVVTHLTFDGLTHPTPQAVGVLLGAGNGTFGAQQTFAVGKYAQAVAVADVNGDGKPDLVVTNGGNNTVSVLLGNGDGTFGTQQTFAAGSDPASVAVVDVNGDGKLDLVVANYEGSTLSLLLGNGDGTFGAQQTFGAGGYPGGVVAADVNGDGRPDLVVLDTWKGQSVQVLLNVSSGAGPLRVNGQALTVSGVTTISSGSIEAGSGTVALGGGLLVIGSGTFLGSTGNVTISDVSIAGNGSLTAPTGAFSVTGNWTNAGGNTVFNPSNATVRFTGSSNQTVTSGGAAFANLVHSGNGSLVPGDSLTVGNNLTVSGGTFLKNGQNVAVGNALVVSGGIFTGDGALDLPSLIVSGGTFDGTLTNLIVDNLTISGTGTLLAPDAQHVFEVDGNWAQMGGTFRADGGTVYFAGSGAQALQSGGQHFQNLSHTGAGSLTLRDALAVDGNLANVSPSVGFSLQPQQTFATGNYPAAVVADVNGDGMPDLLVVNKYDSDVSVMLGTGAGTFGTPQTFAAGNWPYALAVADVNGDGKPDLAVSNSAFSMVSVLLGNGDGSFQLPQTYSTGTNSAPINVAVADINGDGRPDLVVTNYFGGAEVLLGTGNGTFGAAHALTTGFEVIVDVAVADVNGDGKPDLLIVNAYKGSVGVLLGNGNGTFQAQHTFAAGSRAKTVAAADINGDGKLDLVVANYDGNTLSVFLGNGDGTFQAQQTLAAGNSPRALAVADINGDGKPDLVVTNYQNATLSVLLGNGNGTFGAPQTFATGNLPRTVSVADVNGDGRPDLLVANRGDNTVSVLLNAPFPAGSLDAHGQAVSVSGATTIAVGTFTAGAGNLTLGGGLAVTGIGAFVGSTGNVTTGDVLLSGSASLTAPSTGTFAISGNFTNTAGVAAFHANGGSVILDGTGQGLTGNTTFYNLTKMVSTADTLTFQSGSNQTITNNLTLQGGAGRQLLRLRSSHPGSPWLLDPTGNRSVSSVDVKDSDNTSSTAIRASNSFESGDDTGWLTSINLTWTGSVDSNWGNAGNWDLGEVPSAIDDATIPPVANEPVLNATRAVSNLSIQAGASLTLAGHDFTVSGTCTNAGTFILQGNETTVLKQDAAEGTWEYVGDGTGSTIGLKDFGATDYFNLQIDDNHGRRDTFAVNGQDLTVSGTTTISGGNLAAGTGNLSLAGGLAVAVTGTFSGSTGNVAVLDVSLSGAATLTAPTGSFAVFGNWAQSRASQFRNSNGTVSFTGTGVQNLTSAGGTFFDLNHSGGGNLVLQDSLTAAGNLTLSAGALDEHGQNLSVAGLTTVAGGNFTASGNQNLTGGLTLSAGSVNASRAAQLRAGMVTLLGGTFTAPSAGAIFVVSGDWYVSGGAFVAGNGTVSFTGASIQNLTSGGIHFDNLAHTGLGTLVLQDALAVDGSLTNTGGTIPSSVASFQSAQNFPAGSKPVSVAMADVNSDGRPDLVIANENSGTASVLLGNGDGTFQSALTFAAGSRPLSVALGDVNGDGRPDLVVANYGSNTVGVLLGNGDGTFQAQQTFATDSEPFSVAEADVNGDGRCDLIVASAGGNTVDVLLGNGDGTFQAAQALPVGRRPHSVVVGDVNGDGRPDLVAANYSDNTVSVLLGNGDGTFQAAQDFRTRFGPSTVTLADVNGDGRADLIVASSGNDSIDVLLGNGDGTFRLAQNFPVGYSPFFATVADVNGDGKLDLVATNYFSNTVSVLLGNGDGTFQAAQNVPLGYGPFAIAVGDVNGDGRPDLVVGNYNSGTVSVLLNSATSTVGNGTLDAHGQALTVAGPTIVVGGTIQAGSGNLTLAGGLTVSGAGTFSGSTGNVAATDVTISGNATLTAPAGTLSVAGNFTHTSGAFASSNGTVTLTGTQQTVSGNTLFYNLAKTVTSADTLTFQAGSTQTIAGTLTLQGTAGNLLGLRSTLPGSPWNINPQGARNIAFVDVQNSVNINAAAITPSGSHNSGNNTNWSFAGSFLTWTGAVSTSWNTAANWDGNRVPTAADNVVIPNVAVEPVLDVGAAAANLTVQSGAVLTLNGWGLTATGAFINQGTVRLQGTELISLAQDAAEGTWYYTGDGSGGTITLKDFGAADYFNLVICDTHATPDVFQAVADLNVAGSFTLSGSTYQAHGQNTTVGELTITGNTVINNPVAGTVLTFLGPVHTGNATFRVGGPGQGVFTGPVDGNGTLCYPGDFTGNVTINGHLHSAWIGGNMTAGSSLTISSLDLLTTNGAVAGTFHAGNLGQAIVGTLPSTGGLFVTGTLGFVDVMGNAFPNTVHGGMVGGLAVGSVTEGTRVVTALNAGSADAAQLLAAGTILSPGCGVIDTVNLAPGGLVALFLTTTSSFDSRKLLLGNQASTPVTIQLTVGVAGGVSLLQRIDITGDGGTVNTALPLLTALTSSGWLGDLTLSAPQGLTADVTAPTIRGNILVSAGPIAGNITTSGDLGLANVNSAGQITGVTTLQASKDFTGRLICGGNLVSQVTVGGAWSGALALQGDLGIIQLNAQGNAVVGSDAARSLTRFGGVQVGGAFGGQMVVVGNAFGDLVFKNSFNGRVAVRGRQEYNLGAARFGILGNVAICGGMGAGSALVSGGVIGDDGTNDLNNDLVGTHLSVGGSVNGILAAEEDINWGSLGSTKYAKLVAECTGVGAANPNTQAIDAIFTDGGNLLSVLDPAQLNLMLADLAGLLVTGGHLGGTRG